MTDTVDRVVPCPTCWVLADLVPPPPNETFFHSRCPAGHDNTLVPAVLKHLLSLLGPAFSQTA